MSYKADLPGSALKGQLHIRFKQYRYFERCVCVMVKVAQPLMWQRHSCWSFRHRKMKKVFFSSLYLLTLILRKLWRLQGRRLCCPGCPSHRRRVSTLRSNWRLCAGTPSACRTPAPNCRPSTPSYRWPNTQIESMMKLFFHIDNKRVSWTFTFKGWSA